MALAGAEEGASETGVDDCLLTQFPFLSHRSLSGHGGLQISMHCSLTHVYPARQGGLQLVSEIFSSAKIVINVRRSAGPTGILIGETENFLRRAIANSFNIFT
jgi:hypothetical protein